MAHQAHLSKEISRQEYWSGLPFPSPGHLLDPGIKPASSEFPALADRFFTTVPPKKTLIENVLYANFLLATYSSALSPVRSREPCPVRAHESRGDPGEHLPCLLPLSPAPHGWAPGATLDALAMWASYPTACCPQSSQGHRRPWVLEPGRRRTVTVHTLTTCIQHSIGSPNFSN